jgi:hypothetical protein
LSESVTSVFEDAAATKLTVQVAVPAAVKLLGLQFKPLSPADATKGICADWTTPLRFPNTLDVSPKATVPAVTVNCALVCPVTIVALAGVVN